jgi:hypothetical protein
MNYVDTAARIALALLCAGVITAIAEFVVDWRNRD